MGLQTDRLGFHVAIPAIPSSTSRPLGRGVRQVKLAGCIQDTRCLHRHAETAASGTSVRLLVGPGELRCSDRLLFLALLSLCPREEGHDLAVPCLLVFSGNHRQRYQRQRQREMGPSCTLYHRYLWLHVHNLPRDVLPCAGCRYRHGRIMKSPWGTVQLPTASAAFLKHALSRDSLFLHLPSFCSLLLFLFSALLSAFCPLSTLPEAGLQSHVT